MTIIEQIKAEIERHLNSATEHQNANPDMPKYRWYLYEGEKELCTDLLGYIDDSLESEKPMDGLEEEIDACWQNWLSPSNQKEVEGVLPKTEFAMYARHFAKWGADHTPLPEDTVLFNKGVAEGKRLMMEEAVEARVIELGLGDTPHIILGLSDEFKKGDKVRVIVCKKED